MKVQLPAVTLPRSEVDSPDGVIVVPGRILPQRDIDIDSAEVAALIQQARTVAVNAYAPFSKFHVGAALVMADDESSKVFSGSNVENSSYGATNCAERTAIFGASSAGFRTIRIIALTTIDSLNAPLPGRSPCGVCRQVIKEFSNADTLVAIDTGGDGVLCELMDVERLLPFGFHFGAKR